MVPEGSVLKREIREEGLSSGSGPVHRDWRLSRFLRCRNQVNGFSSEMREMRQKLSFSFISVVLKVVRNEQMCVRTTAPAPLRSGRAFARSSCQCDNYDPAIFGSGTRLTVLGKKVGRFQCPLPFSEHKRGSWGGFGSFCWFDKRAEMFRVRFCARRRVGGRLARSPFRRCWQTLCCSRL